MCKKLFIFNFFLGKKGKKKGSDESGGEDGEGAHTAEDEDTPVRQSRRIAQLKIREEAQRRMLEEVTLRELKAKHNKVSVSVCVQANNNFFLYVNTF